MPRTSSGTFTRVSNSFSEPVFGTVIDPTDAIELFDDYDDGITDSLSRTGEGTMEANLELGGFSITSAASIIFKGATSGTTTLRSSSAASGNIRLPAATDILIGKATTDTLTNKTFDTAGSGNSFSINGLAATANTGTGAVVRATSATLIGPVITGGTVTVLNTSTIALRGSSSGATLLKAQATASGTITVPSATDTLVGKATTDTLTNKTFNTAGTGNSLQINSLAVTANTGTGGTVVRSSSATISVPTLVTPILGVATATSVNGLAITTTTGTLALANSSTLNTSGAFGLTLTATGTTNSTMPVGTHTLGGLDVAQAWTATQTFSAATNSIALGANSGNLGVALFYGSTSGDVTVRSAAVAGTSTIFQLPASNGTSGYVLQTNGSGVTSWVATGAASSITVGSTTINSGATTSILYDNAGTLGEYTISGSGTIVAMATAPTFVTSLTISSAPLITSGNISAAAWTTAGVRFKAAAASYTDTSSSGTVTAAYTDVFGVGTILASSSTTYTNYFGSYFLDPVASTNVTMTAKWALGADSLYIGTSNPLKVTTAGVLTATSPVLTTPTLGVASATTVNKVTLTAPASGSTLTIADGKVLTASNTLTFSGTDSSTLAIGVGGTLTGSSSAAIWYDNIPQNSQSTAYTTVLSDAQKHLLHPTADNNARTFTIAANASVAYPIGTAITFVNQINTVTIAITSDTLTLAGSGSTGSRTLAANGVATALKVAATVWFISGTGIT